MKTKLELGRLLLTEKDLLVSTNRRNFLDIGYIGWLGIISCKLKRAYIVISHDRAFLNKVQNKIVEIATENSGLRGNYEYYVVEKQRREEIQEQQSIAQGKFIERSEAYVSAHLYCNSGGRVKTKRRGSKKCSTFERIEKPDEIVKRSLHSNTKRARQSI